MSLRTALVRTAGLSTRARPTAALARAAGGEFYEPTGYLFGEKPLPKGQKRTKDWWEEIYYWSVGGGFALTAVGLYFKPDTNVQTWARKEAERQMAEAGEFQDD
ncbi:ESSS subunit of NADH:ubiquinone oxidoreductase [Blastocladiella britannica]|nr:ESSS subunit of NADH:ubiquinone oxidoreductase [Blastocladiella britannica]